MTIATSAVFTFKNNAIWIEYKQAGKNWSANITGKLVQSDFVVSGGIQISNDPKGRSIGAFIGVSF